MTLSVNEIATIFAAEFGTTPGRVLKPAGPGGRHYQRIRWALAMYLATRFSQRTPSNNHGLNHTARLLQVDHSTLVTARKRFFEIITEPHYRRKVELAWATAAKKDGCNLSLQQLLEKTC